MNTIIKATDSKQNKKSNKANRYYQIRIYETEPDKLLRKCDLCFGEVYMEMEDGSLVSLKNDAFLRLAFRSMNMSASGVKLFITDACDLSLFIGYLSGVWTALR